MDLIWRMEKFRKDYGVVLGDAAHINGGALRVPATTATTSRALLDDPLPPPTHGVQPSATAAEEAAGWAWFIVLA